MITTSSTTLNQEIGSMEPVRILYEYDAPFLFTFMDNKSRSCLAYLAESKDGETVYLAKQFSDSELETAILENFLVRDVFKKRQVWVVQVVSDGKTQNVRQLDASKIPERLLPPDTIRFT